MSNLAELRVVESITNYLRQDLEIIFVHFGRENEINPERMTGYADTTDEESSTGPELYSRSMALLYERRRGSSALYSR
jgi:hypothetical protein